MDAELINPFIESATNVLKTMAQTEAVPGKPRLKRNNVSWGSITGLIGMTGDDVIGNMILSFDTPCILSIASKMLMEEFVEINKDVIDAVGEITNMICGGTKKSLREHGYGVCMATPIVITGKEVALSQLTKSPIITIPFNTPAGEFVIEANLAKRM